MHHGNVQCISGCSKKTIDLALVEKETTVELVVKDYPIGHKKYGLSRQVVFVDSFNCIEM